MTSKTRRCIIQCALVATSFGMLISSATAGSFTRGCAARDMQILMLIEEREDANVSRIRLNDALLAMMHARMVCHEGNVVEALAIYEGIAQSLTTGPALSGRMNATAESNPIP
jgi:hypothetical protein